MNFKPVFIWLFSIACTNSKQPAINSSDNLFPKHLEKPPSLPPKEKFFLFIMAGQSNMAGRGVIEAQDTIQSPFVLVLDKNNEWVYAKEPLHYYEPERTGLDCGLSFGKELAKLYGEKTVIGLIPCAVGGSSIEQWLGDSTYRNVTLYSNLLSKTRKSLSQGTLKGILWHQGETNANTANYRAYKQKLERFFSRLREDVNHPDLPVYTGQLASFLSRRSNPFADSVNKDLNTLSASLQSFHVIHTTDLRCKPDSIHFDSPSLRTMGKRFAEKVFQTDH